jgi:hypothetical protein
MTAGNFRFEIGGGHNLRLRAIALALRGPPLQLQRLIEVRNQIFRSLNSHG